MLWCTYVDRLVNYLQTDGTIRGCRGGQHRRPAPVYTESGSTGVRIISGNRPVKRPLSQSQSANTRGAPVQHREPALICPRISRHAIQRSRLTRFGCLNVRSVNNKIDDVRLLMQEEKLYVLALTETWYEDSDCTTIKRLRGLGLNVLETARPIDDKRRQAKANLLITAALPSPTRKESLYPRLALGRRQQHLNICAAGRPLEAAVIILVVLYLDHNQFAGVFRRVFLIPSSPRQYVCSSYYHRRRKHPYGADSGPRGSQ